MAKKKQNKTTSETKKASLPTFHIPRKVAIIFAGFIGLLALLSLTLAGYTLQYKNKIYPHTYVGNLELGGKTKKQAEELLSSKFASLPPAISVQIGDKTSSLAKDEIELHYSSETTSEALLQVGRVGSVTQNVRELINSLNRGNHVNARYTLNEAKTQQHLTKIAAQDGKLPQDAKIVLSETDIPIIQAEQPGYGVLPSQLRQDLSTALSALNSDIKGIPTTLDPTITTEHAQSALEKTKQILAKSPLTLTADKTLITADTDKVFSWITYDIITPTQSSSSSIKWIEKTSAHQDEAEATLSARLDQEKIKSFVQDLAVPINVEPQNAELRAVNNEITVTRIHIDGKKVNLDKTVELITTGLLNETTSEKLTITVPVETTSAQVRGDNIVDLGIKELIGHAETTYKGSPENRQHNIATGAKFLNGILLAPGQEFSTVKTLGKVDGSTGYLPELVIKENRTTPEFGGGLCQVSTTLFRSVLNAGLKVTERQNHSYRVSYYEPPVGLDATIYLPKPDFRFVNDTPGYILIQNKIEGTKITFDLYGTKDGRSSTVSDTTILSTTPAGNPIYAETDTLKKGETKQIEKAHDGAVTVVTYTVIRDGKEINKQVFKSTYKAWPARFLVGTREQ